MPTLTHGDGQDLLDAYKRAWEARDPDLGTDLFSEDGEFRTDPFDEPMRGSIAIREFWNRHAATQVNAELDAERIWVAADTVLASFHGATTERATGRRSRLRGFMTLELDAAHRVVRGRQWIVRRTVGADSTVEVPEEAGRGG